MPEDKTPKQQKPDENRQQVKKSRRREVEFGVGSNFYEGKVILGAKPVVAPWEQCLETDQTAMSNVVYDRETALGETGGQDEPGGTIGDTTD